MAFVRTDHYGVIRKHSSGGLKFQELLWRSSFYLESTSARQDKKSRVRQLLLINESCFHNYVLTWSCVNKIALLQARTEHLEIKSTTNLAILSQATI